MARNVLVVLFAVTTLGACAQSTPEQQIIDDATTALGGLQAIEAVTTLSFEGAGERGNLGQDLTPDATTQTFAISDYRQSLDLSTGQRRVEQTRTPNFNYFRGPDPIQQISGIDGGVAYNVAPDGSATRAPNATASVRRLAFYLYPLTAVRAALESAATTSNARAVDGESLVDITTSDGVELTLAIDASSKLPTRLSSVANHPNLRDVTFEARFEDYEETDGLMLPSRMTVSIDDFRLTDLRLSAYTVNGDVGDLSAPEAASSAEPITGPPPANVAAEEVADGVWFLAGESHHSVLVELSDHTLLIEAPSEIRTLAVIETARELLPDKPLTHLVSTHHHFDHSGGIRAAMSEGLTIITQVANASFYNELAKRTSTIVPDALERNPQPAKIEAVKDEATHGDDSMTVELYLIEGNPHGDAILMAYLPAQRLLVQADAFSPGRDYQPFATNLLENIRERDLQVDRILPIHGGIVTLEELVNAVQSMTD